MSRHVDRLQSAVSAVSLMLETYARARTRGAMAPATPLPPPGDLGEPVEGSALDAMAGWFGLTPFELAVVVLAAGVEISPDTANLCAVAQGDSAMPFPTTLLALAVFGDLEGASQAALGPSAALRHWKLITAEPRQPGGRFHLQIGIPDAVLSFLIGNAVLDEALAPLMSVAEPVAQLPSDAALTRELAAAVAAGDDVILHLVAPPTRRALGLTAAVAATLGHVPYHLPLARLSASTEQQQVARLWQRDRLGLAGALLVSFEEPPADHALAALGALIGESPGPLFLIGTGGQAVAERATSAIVRVPLPPTDPAEIADQLAGTLDVPPAPELREIADRFRLPVPTLESCAMIAQAKAATPEGPAPLDAILPHLRVLLRDQVREGMSGLADRVPARMTLDDLVLPDPARTVLAQIVARQRNRGLVLDEWGFRTSGGGPQGMSVLFAGPSGTGKTMAAEALARALDLDLFRVDLSRIVDKYIGETEKKLAALFDAADATDAILLFDEADALFGRRTELRDSHDRYANLETGYLLQRIESFRGIAILTTNLPNAIDEAFARRFAFTLHFEFPASDERREIWRRAFPAAAPTAGLDWEKLAKLSLSGGQIRVIVVNAAMLAADEGAAIGMSHIARALVSEYGKQRRRVPVAELAGWPS